MVDILRQNPLYRKTGNEIKQVNPNEVLGGIHMMGYYFGANWCSDCVKFTAILKDFYTKVKANNESFEIVYVSSDKTEQEMKKFVLESHGDWLIFHLDESDDEGKNFETAWDFRELFAITGIPSFTVTKKEDEELCTMDGVTELLTKGVDVFKEWKRRREMFIMGHENEDDEVREEGKIMPNCCKISRFKPWTQKLPVEILSGKKLLRKTGEDLVEESVDKAIGTAEIVAFYFAANWCGPCHVFTPELKKAYDKLKAQKKAFEVVFVSGDHTEEEMRTYMLRIHGNWLATEYNNATEKSLCKMFAVNSVPTLRIVNKKGDLISKNGIRDIRVKGASAFSPWMKGTAAATKEDEAKFWEQDGEQQED